MELLIILEGEEGRDGGREGRMGGGRGREYSGGGTTPTSGPQSVRVCWQA